VKALSALGPWAKLTCQKEKLIETRSQKTTRVIHASLKK